MDARFGASWWRLSGLWESLLTSLTWHPFVCHAVVRSQHVSGAPFSAVSCLLRQRHKESPAPTPLLYTTALMEQHVTMQSAFVYACMYKFVYACMYPFVYAWHVPICVCMNVPIRVCMHVQIRVCNHVPISERMTCTHSRTHDMYPFVYA